MFVFHLSQSHTDDSNDSLLSLFKTGLLKIRIWFVLTIWPEGIRQKCIFEVLQLRHALDDVMTALQVLTHFGLWQRRGVVKKFGDLHGTIVDQTFLEKIRHALKNNM
jgi:hypothetical protein